MVDKVQSKKDFDDLDKDRRLLLSLNHLNSTSAFKRSCEERLQQIRECQKVIKHNLSK